LAFQWEDYSAHIAGFDRPTSGQIFYMGRKFPIYAIQRDVNTVFQDYAPHMTVGDNIAYGLMIKTCGKRRAKEAWMICSNSFSFLIF
jgi:ABC-type Fe3+/spermidine/putrescine transport system ATPase subunit